MFNIDVCTVERRRKRKKRKEEKRVERKIIAEQLQLLLHN
jgi:hypothetical protein